MPQSETLPKPELPLQRLEKKTAPPLQKIMLPVTSLASGTLLTLALPDLIAAHGVIDHGKCIVMGAAATFISYSINRFALEKGARQAAIGSVSAGVVSTASVLLIGTAMATATYGGFTRAETDRLRLASYQAEYTVWIQQQDANTPATDDAVMALRAVASDLEAKTACEEQSSCISGKGSGGKGTAFRTQEAARSSAQAVLSQIEAQEKERARDEDARDNLLRQMETVLGADGLSVETRRNQLQDMSANAAALSQELRGASAASLVAGFAAQLQSQEGNAPQDRLLVKYGHQLARASAERGSAAYMPPPAFPLPSGVSDTLHYVRHFLPVALLITACELVLPMCLFIYALIDLRARLEDQERSEKSPKYSPRTKGA